MSAQKLAPGDRVLMKEWCMYGIVVSKALYIEPHTWYRIAFEEVVFKNDTVVRYARSALTYRGITTIEERLLHYHPLVRAICSS